MGWLLKRQCVDPVCGKRIDPVKSGIAAVHGRCAFYFCSPQCWEAFQKAPALYSAKAIPASQSWWERYLPRLTKATRGKPPCCH